MRVKPWKLFAGILVAAAAYYLANPLGIPSLDPRARMLGFVLYSVPSQSMQPTLESGDLVLCNIWPYVLGEPKRGDILVFRVPDKTAASYVKRVIGLPGDLLAMYDHQVYINEVAIAEPYIRRPFFPGRGSYGSLAPTRIPAGHYFMLGDSRDNSRDSRIFGLVPKANLIGRIDTIF
ncbi:signal peptidase I [Pseudomonas sp. L-22-4S-12]|uniref:signal peptidase I n=1 Tax=Pseudomonas sp. L-22-4S-12 TaxID=2610893 RepID=UPI001324134E|nr:signal peptidase I [Pseudomonas sp. L-22-4S-12]MWV17979.1 signal peptidase I [Pseudomonas sp. L-22-4S-12]